MEKNFAFGRGGLAAVVAAVEDFLVGVSAPRLDALAVVFRTKFEPVVQAVSAELECAEQQR